jgi:hypothetical protein
MDAAADFGAGGAVAMNSPVTSTRQCAFTLLELLVVEKEG